MEDLDKEIFSKDRETLSKIPYGVLEVLRDLTEGKISKEEADELLLPFLMEKQVS